MPLTVIRISRSLFLITLLMAGVGTSGGLTVPSSGPDTSSHLGAYIVQAPNAAAAAAAVAQVGGTVTERLGIIDAVAATLDAAALARLRTYPQIVLHADAYVGAAGDLTATTVPGSDASEKKSSKETVTEGYLLYPAAATGANLLHGQLVSTRKTICQNQQVMVSNQLEQRPLQGWGVTVAVVDSGFMQMRSPVDWTSWDSATGTLVAEAAGRCIVYRDFLPQTTQNSNAGTNGHNSVDQNGHATHVISTIADNRATPLAANISASPVGVAPQVNLLVARALDKDGGGSYASVIAAIQWIVDNRATYNVRVLNLSIYAPVVSPYWADPLGQAVMKAWQAGITVVVAAGNGGASAGTITVPGNIPYVITVGAIKSGRYTQSGYDELAAYSSRGPTESAFVKPDLLVPASRTIAPMPDDSTLGMELLQDCAKKAAAGALQPCIETKADVDYRIGHPAKQHTYFYLSGTSMAAAEVSGIVALMLQAHPDLTNDQVKGRLLATARAAVDTATDQPIYSPWEQGAGLVDTQQAVFTTTLAAANLGMDISLDLTTDTHYWGYTQWNDPPGEFRLIDPDNGQPLTTWAGGSRTWAGGSRTWAGSDSLWAGGSRTWAGGSRTWAGGSRTWAGSDSLWAGGSRTWAGSTADPVMSAGSHAESSKELLILDTEFRVLVPVANR
jgi:serine protease AprX